MSDINWVSVLGLKNESIEDLRFVGYSYLRQGQFEIAIKIFNALVILTEDNVYDLQTLGALYLQTGNNLLALDYLEQALRKQPNDPKTLLNRIKVLFSLGYRRQAMAQAAKLAQYPDHKIADQASALLLSHR
ncbi:MAG: type III secretion chaperone [Chlamydiae bacterium]|jgi:tetratricopeptide (TPR) repeat protein|nr:type III secretion chaperone [Chlamydiota bacterium]